VAIAVGYILMGALFIYVAFQTENWLLIVVLLLFAALDIFVGIKQIKKALQRKK
jgi:hypothetical protein